MHILLLNISVFFLSHDITSSVLLLRPFSYSAWCCVIYYCCLCLFFTGGTEIKDTDTDISLVETQFNFL